MNGVRIPAQVNREGTKTHLKTEKIIEVDSADDSASGLSHVSRNSVFQNALDLGVFARHSETSAYLVT
jgi:hypothetical protein